jgi:hypothetical protein
VGSLRSSAQRSEGARRAHSTRSHTRSILTFRFPDPRVWSTVRDHSSSPSTSPAEDTAADANDPSNLCETWKVRWKDALTVSHINGLRARRRANGAHTQQGDCILAMVDDIVVADMRRCLRFVANRRPQPVRRPPISLFAAQSASRGGSRLTGSSDAGDGLYTHAPLTAPDCASKCASILGEFVRLGSPLEAYVRPTPWQRTAFVSFCKVRLPPHVRRQVRVRAWPRRPVLVTPDEGDDGGRSDGPRIYRTNHRKRSTGSARSQPVSCSRRVLRRHPLRRRLY